jgi:hypothetical protein
MMFITKMLFCGALQGPVTQNFYEPQHFAVIIVNRSEFSDRPKARTVFAQPPAFLAATSCLPGILHLLGELSASALIVCKYAI